MKKITLIFILAAIVAGITMSNAQSYLTLKASQSYSSFKFSDSENNSLNSEYKGLYTGSYDVGYRYLFDYGLLICSGVGIRNGGASLDYDDMNYQWKLKYANVKLGAGYMLRFKQVSPYLCASGYFAYMLHGVQTLNNEHFNIVGSELMNKIDYGVMIIPGVEYKISEALSLLLEFDYLMGLANIEQDEAQEAYNYAYTLSLGLSVSF